ncbi:MAG: radical SAM protein, partial [bacterium]
MSSPVGRFKSDLGSFLSVWRARFRGARSTQLPVVYLDITDRCNSACAGCNKWQVQKNMPPELTTDEILNLIPAMRRLKTRLISIGGGEPTLRRDLETCFRSFRDEGIAIHMVTNGLGISQERAKSLVDAGLTVVYISWDHCDRDIYKAIRGIDGVEGAIATVNNFKSLPKPIPIGINITVSRLNETALEEIAEQCIGWGVQKIQFIPIHMHLQQKNMDEIIFKPLLPDDINSIKATLRRIVNRLRKLKIETNSSFFIEHFDYAYRPVRAVPCISGFLYAIIDPFGEVTLCYQYPTGLNVRKLPFDEII